MTVKLAVFDCDGTLVDGQGAICEAMEVAFAENGLTRPNRHDVRRAVGLSLPQAMRLLLPGEPAALHEALSASYRSVFRAARTSGQLSEPLFEGIAPLLDALREAGWTLGVATGKSDRGLSHCLACHGIADHFVTLQTADRHPSKPHPAMLQAALAEASAQACDTVMIGDTGYDMEMAREAGVRPIGVAWGYHSADELGAAGAEFVAGTPAELQAYILGMSDDPSRKRFVIIQAVRWLGVASALAGLLVLQGVWAWPVWVGYLLLFNGLLDALFVPTILARRWRTPPPA